MVKITKHLKLNASIKKVAPKIKKLSRKQIFFICLFLCLVTVALAVPIFINKKPNISCKDLSVQSAQTIAQAGDDQDIINLNQKLEANGKTCESNNKRLSVDEKLNRIQFYHDKATTNYMLAKFDEAKKDAKSGLELNATLKDSEKTLKKHDHIIQDLENVRDGKY